MAQFDFTKKLDIDETQEAQLHIESIEPTDVMTGDRNKRRFLYYQLKMSMQKAVRIDIIVSFLMESGVKMILKDLRAALDRGVQIRILTGNYLGITQPSALFLIKKELGDRIDLRFYNDKERSFHPKAYIFHYENSGEIFIGSSNISKSALTSGIEWNYRFGSLADGENFRLFYETFLDLFEHHSIVIDDAELTAYSRNWHKPAVSKDLTRYDDLEDGVENIDIADNIKMEAFFQPRGAQIEALYALENSRAEGA
ncbi:MAG: NgoFVII family restriction endonuclease, partial [Lachnospiraceae bacterium]|nr:NgoFVII family restriction endonuclease [Lachnospiraceae bacterium]